MDDDDVRPEQFLPAGDLLDDGLAVMDDELEVEVRDPRARVALAGRRLADVAATAAEPEVAALDGVEQHRAVDPLDRLEGEGCVALELGQAEVRAKRRDDGADEVRQDVLGMIELDIREVAGVPGDVGDEEAGRLCGREHRPPLYGGPRRVLSHVLMTCSTCGATNPPDGRFCLECGSALGGCPNCGASNPAGARFCGNCGTNLATAAATHSAATRPTIADPRGTATERRVVSVLFADLVGFTTISADRDPETMRDLQDRYFERTRVIVDRYGGVIEKFIGDAVMAMWGAPVAFEDDAERAVRAGLELVDMVPALGREMGVDLAIRAGVLTGEAAVTLGTAGQGMVTGDMVNTAARLQSVAPAGGVLVGEATRMAAEAAIEFIPAGDQVLKGKTSTVPSWLAVRVVGERGGARRPDALEPPFVGRTDELRFLKEQFHAVGRERRARLVSLVGQAGIGKSRLAWELEKYLDGVVEQVWWHRGRSPSYGEGVTFWALGEMIRRRAGLAEGDGEEATRLGGRHDDARRTSRTTPSVPGSSRGSSSLLGIGDTPAGGRAELFAAWRTFFERLAETGPVAFVVEDLQWSDDGLLDFLEHLLDWGRSSPFFVLTLARPELLERRPGWGTDRRGAMLDAARSADRRRDARAPRGHGPGPARDGLVTDRRACRRPAAVRRRDHPDARRQRSAGPGGRPPRRRGQAPRRGRHGHPRGPADAPRTRWSRPGSIGWPPRIARSSRTRRSSARRSASRGWPPSRARPRRPSSRASTSSSGARS